MKARPWEENCWLQCYDTYCVDENSGSACADPTGYENCRQGCDNAGGGGGYPGDSSGNGDFIYDKHDLPYDEIPSSLICDPSFSDF